jgi:hypothetical protein
LAVRVKIRVKSRSSSKSLEIPVLVNGGAESTKPCIVVDEDVARELGLWPISHGRVLEVEEASSIGEAFVVEDSVELELIGEDGEVLSRIKADLVVQRGLIEPLITDATIDELGIQVLSFSRGLWRHVSDPPGRIRASVPKT